MPFPDAERDVLLATPGLGPVTIQRLEAAGFESLAALHRFGIASAVDLVCKQLGASGWANRRRPLTRAVELAHRQLLGVTSQTREKVAPQRPGR
jgi:hypothetical protein